MRTAAVVGAGVAGRLTALRLQRAGWRVELFDRAPLAARDSASFAAAGLLAPFAEAAALAPAERWICELGREAPRAWAELAASLPTLVHVRARGSIVAARSTDVGQLEEFRARVTLASAAAEVKILDRGALAELEPALAGSCVRGLLIEGEGAVNGGEAMDALLAALAAEGVALRFATPVDDLAGLPHDAIVDARGLGARSEMPGKLRGVRGELVELEAPEVAIERPIRIVHARYPVYIVPRGGRRYIVGATTLESEDTSPITVTSMMELLSAVYDLHPGFREAAIVRTVAQLRPALYDGAPKIATSGKIVRVNGLHRHGFLLAPAVTAAVARLVVSGERSGPAELYA